MNLPPEDLKNYVELQQEIQTNESIRAKLRRNRRKNDENAKNGVGKVGIIQNLFENDSKMLTLDPNLKKLEISDNPMVPKTEETKFKK